MYMDSRLFSYSHQNTSTFFFFAGQSVKYSESSFFINRSYSLLIRAFSATLTGDRRLNKPSKTNGTVLFWPVLMILSLYYYNYSFASRVNTKHYPRLSSSTLAIVLSADDEDDGGWWCRHIASHCLFATQSVSSSRPVLFNLVSQPSLGIPNIGQNQQRWKWNPV